MVAVVWLTGLITLWIGLPGAARDLPAAGDGEYLWLVLEDPDASEDDGPGRVVYHTSAARGPGELFALDPMKGRLMKRGIAAGDGRLLMITEDRRVQAVRPTWTPLLERYLYEKRSLPDLPEGCAVLSVALSARGPWVLVRVEDASALETIKPAERLDDATLRRRLLNRALGLPEDFELGGAGRGGGGDVDAGGDESEAGEGQADDTASEGAAEDEVAEEDAGSDAADGTEQGNDAEAEPAAQTGAEAQAGEPGGGDTEGDPGTDAQSDDGAAAPKTPVLRLLTLRGGAWVSSPLPEGLPEPRHAELVMEDDDERPTLIVEAPGEAGDGDGGAVPARLIRYSPIAPAREGELPGWAEQATTPSPGVGRLWSAAMVKGQTAVAVERRRSFEWLDVDGYLLRRGSAIRFADFPMNTQTGPRWTAIPWQGALAVVVSPGPRDTSSDENTQANPNPPIAAMYAVGLNGKPRRILAPGSDNAADAGSALVLLREPDRPADPGSLDLYIQIGTFTVAMLLMIGFYRRAPRPEQIDLPDHLVLASFTRRIIAGFIDLTPGFLVAGLVYDTTMNETMLYWPGNGVPKVFSAMQPGLLAIAVTVAHTTVFELVTARSIGKWLTGLYVADLSGKPAGPWPCTARALSRVFDLFAPLILIVAIISPARQRLGDILAKTTVVMQKPEPLDLGDEE